MERFHKTGTSIKITNDGKTITNVSNRYASCYGLLSVPSTEPYCHIWRFQIVSEYNTWTCVGIDATTDTVDERFYEKSPHSYAYKACSKIFGKKKQRQNFSRGYGNEDTVEMILNLAGGYLRFRVASKKDHHSIYEARAFKSIQRDANVKYHMAVSLSCSGDSVTLLQYSNNKQEVAEQKELKSLREENALLTQQNAKLQQELCNLLLPKIIHCASVPKENVRMKEDVVKQHETAMQEINIHDNRLKQWQRDLETLSNSLKNDDELLDNYLSCKQKWEQQERRMEEVMRYCHELNKLKKSSKAQSQVYHEEVLPALLTNYNELLIKYKNCKANRIKSEKSFKEIKQQTIHAIDDENTSNGAQCKALDDYNVHRVESNNLDKILTHSIALIKGYNDFDTQTEQKIESIKSHFNQRWITFMRNWYDWNCEDVICWIKYLCNEHKLAISKETNLKTILQEMKKQKLNGISLVRVDKECLRSIGFVNINENEQIYQRIHELISKYPVDTEGDNEGVMIPKEFLCPLSKKIMRKPVKIFDDYTYERTAIEPYLEQHHKSPMTNEPCDSDDLWMLPNRILQQKIQIFLSTHPEIEPKFMK